MKYTVEVQRVVSVAVEVEADDANLAIEAAKLADLPAIDAGDVLDSYVWIAYDVRGGDWVEMARED